MTEEQIKLLNYISENYDTVVKPAKNGEYIEIDLIPSCHHGLRVHDLTEIVDSCNKLGIDITMFTRSYAPKIGDGIRMGRYFYFMQETTKEILNDLKSIQ